MKLGVEIFGSNHPKMEDGVPHFAVISDKSPDETIIAIVLEDRTGTTWNFEILGPNAYYFESEDDIYQIPYLEVQWAR